MAGGECSERARPPRHEPPLACIPEGGTWAAGREIAAEKRADGAPPITIDSDGTVFQRGAVVVDCKGIPSPLRDEGRPTAA